MPSRLLMCLTPPFLTGLFVLTGRPIMTSSFDSRLRRAFVRQGISLERSGSTWSVRRGKDFARILLPDNFELEDKAVRQY